MLTVFSSAVKMLSELKVKMGTELDATILALPRKHELVRQHLEAEIGRGLEPHQKLPTERDLAETFNVNRVTIRRALSELEHDGVIYRVQGSGTFVSDTRIRKAFEFTSFSEDMQMRGMMPGSLSVKLTTEPAGMQVGYALGLSPATQVVHVRRVRTADGTPICLESSFIPHALVPGLENGLEQDSLYEDLAHRYGIQADRADQTIRSTVVSETEAAELLVPAFSPAFLVQRTSFDQSGTAIEFAESRYRGDRYSYSVSITRPAHRGRF
jgi:GntR family transcriptional regulator